MPSDPWARAAARMARGVGSVEASYQFVEGGPSKAVRLIPSQEEASAGAQFGRPGSSATVRVMTLVAAEIAPGRPQKNDLVGLGTEGGWRVEKAVEDAERATFTLWLRRQ